MSKKVLVFDTETGGLDSNEHDVLTLGFVAADIVSGKIHDKLYIEVSHDTYRVTGKALQVNGIDLVKHHKKALTEKDAVGQIVDFIKKNFKGNIPVTPAGQNLPFDEGFVKKLFEKAGAKYNDFIHYSYLDTMPVLRFLAKLGVIPDSACRLQGAKKHFDVKQKRGSSHNAIGDAEATVAIFAKLAELVNPSEDKAKDDVEETEEEQKPKKKRGRPKNKAKVEPEPEEENDLPEELEDDEDDNSDDDEDDNLDDDDDDDNDDDDDDLKDDEDDDEEW